MKNKSIQIIRYGTMIIVGTYFLFLGLSRAKSFFIPFSIAVFLSLVMLPVANKLERTGISRGFSVFISDLMILLFCSAIVFIVSFEIYNIVEDWPKYEKQLQPKIERVQQYVSQKTGISQEKIQTEMNKIFNKTKNDTGVYSSIQEYISFSGNFLLVFIYIFFLMYYRHKIKNSILVFISEKERSKTNDIIMAASKVAQQYLFGRFILILILSVVYSLGLILLGLEQAILISILSAVLTLNTIHRKRNWIWYRHAHGGTFLGGNWNIYRNYTCIYLNSICGKLYFGTLHCWRESGPEPHAYHNWSHCFGHGLGISGYVCCHSGSGCYQSNF